MSDLEHPSRFLPQQVAIDSYGNGGFRFGDYSHQGALFFLPTGVYSWDAGLEGLKNPEQYSLIKQTGSQIDVLFIGTGVDLVPMASTLKDTMRDELGLIVEAMSTGSAIRTYNVLLAEKRAIGAALLPVDNAFRN